jgi:hypothetical protein
VLKTGISGLNITMSDINRFLFPTFKYTTNNQTHTQRLFPTRKNIRLPCFKYWRKPFSIEPFPYGWMEIMDKRTWRKLSNPTLTTQSSYRVYRASETSDAFAAHLLIKFFDAKPYAELYSPTFPDYISISSKGNCASTAIRILLPPVREEQHHNHDW